MMSIPRPVLGSKNKKTLTIPAIRDIFKRPVETLVFRFTVSNYLQLMFLVNINLKFYNSFQPEKPVFNVTNW